MNEFTKRAVFGAIYVAIILASISFHYLGLLALVVVLLILASNELKHLLGLKESTQLINGTSILGVLLLWAHSSFTVSYQNHLAAFLGLFLVLGLSISVLTKGSESSAKPALFQGLSTIYLLIPLALTFNIAFIKGFWQQHYLLALFFFLWSNDTFAYLSGKQFGKHKLLERLSPKKTIEGFIGGLLGALAVAFLLSIYWQELSLIQWLVFAFIVSLFGTIGDLFESSLKRAARIKDSGNLIPGHGGILDRIDSFLFAVPASYFYLYFFG